MYLGWGRGYRKGPRASKEPFIDPGQAHRMPVFPGIFWGKALQRAWLVWHLLQGFHTRPGAIESPRGSGGWEAGADIPSSSATRTPGGPPARLKSIRFPLRPSPPQAEPGSPHRGTESAGMRARWEEGAASGQTQAGRMAGPHRVSHPGPASAWGCVWSEEVLASRELPCQPLTITVILGLP